MAEWTGPRRRPSRPDPTAAAPGIAPDPPEAPGAVDSPQIPGQVPDRSTIPGQFRTRVEAAPNAPRPLTEYQTAQRIMHVYAAAPGEERNPTRFEQATASFEELRKANPALLPPARPVPGFALAPTEEMKELHSGEDSTEIAPGS